MAVYTDVNEEELAGFLTNYDLGTLMSFKGIAEGVENTNYLLHTQRGYFILTLYEKRVSRAEKVIFVDAAVDAANEVQWRKLVPNETSQLMAHAANPRTMLALARDVFGRAPEAWWLTIPAVDLGFHEEFSTTAQQGFAEAVEKIQAFCRKPVA